MSIKLPVVFKGITLAEIPGKITYFIELGNCIRRCKGCHSPQLSEPIPDSMFTDLSELIENIKEQKSRGAEAILLMGGTTNQLSLETLARTIQELAKILPVGIYSGDDVDSYSTRFLKELPGLQWIKAGEYNEKLGGLSSPTTNQKFYEKSNLLQFDGYGVYVDSIPKWEDVTSRFQ